MACRSTRFWLAFLAVMASGIPGVCQRRPGSLTLVPFPVVYYSPETRLVGGLAAVGTFRFRRDSASVRPSSITSGAAYTQNRQLLIYLTYNVFYDSARWFAYGEAGWYRYSYKFFGLGRTETPEVLYGVDYPRIKINVTRRIRPGLYAGMGYQYENYRIRDTAVVGPLAGSTIPGNRGSRSSGLGPQVLYDSRDTVLFPSRGILLSASWLSNGRLFGGDRQFDRYVLDIAAYRALRPGVILAANSFTSFVTGDPPFQQQSLLGGNKRMRGYYEGRFIDRNMTVLQAELRFRIWRRFWGAAFGGGAALGGRGDLFRFHDLKYAAGAGLRFNLVKKDHLNLRLDYAVGPGTSGIYFTVGEAF